MAGYAAGLPYPHPSKPHPKPRIHMITNRLVFLLSGLLLISCSSSRDTSDATVTAEQSVKLNVLRFDNDGRMTKDSDLEDLRQKILATPQTVVVFMHGWHGSASDDDNSVRQFKRALYEVRNRSYEKSGRTLTGVYLTWNARHLPGIAEYPMYYFTQGRADSVAKGDGIYDAIEKLSKAARTHRGERFIVAGHSFGGRILGHVVGRHPQLLQNVDLWLLANAADNATDCENTINAVNAHPYRRGRLPKLVWVTSAHDPMTGFAFTLANLSRTGGWDRSLQTDSVSIEAPTAENPRYSANVTQLSKAPEKYVHNLIVTNGLKGHSDVWGEPMIQIVNYYVLHQ
jgi:pimeloyl-ACP methyl ester carboxylesterase